MPIQIIINNTDKIYIQHRTQTQACIQILYYILLYEEIYKISERYVY